MKSKDKICPICGAKFTPDSNNQIYCGIFCQAQGRRVKRVAWNASHPHYYRDYMRKKRISMVLGIKS